MTQLALWFMAIAFNSEPGMIYERCLIYEHYGIWGDNWYTGQLTPAAAHAFHARDAPQSKLSFRQLRQHGTESSSLPAAAVPSGERRWTPAWGNAQDWPPACTRYIFTSRRRSRTYRADSFGPSDSFHEFPSSHLNRFHRRKVRHVGCQRLINNSSPGVARNIYNESLFFMTKLLKFNVRSIGKSVFQSQFNCCANRLIR